MYRLQKLKLDWAAVSRKLAQREGQRDLLLSQRAQNEEHLRKAQEALGQFDLVQILLQKTSDFARQQAKSRIEEIVTSALSVVFGKDYRFHVGLDVKGNQPIAEYYLTSEGVTTQLKPPDYDRGGGVADVVSLALRLAVGELSGIDGPLFLDEIGKHVSADFAPNVAYFLKQYSSQFGRQIILVTHSEALSDVGDLSLVVKQANARSVVEVQ